jgi:hypothetical protein
MYWFDYLEAVRRVSRRKKRKGEDIGFTAEDLVEEAEIGPTKDSSAKQIASGFLSKLTRWGYIKRHGKQGALRVYKITRWGLKYKPRKKK